MRYLWQHAFLILDTYRGELPLHHFLKQYYRQHPKLGSRDRRALGDIAYSWYRCSKAIGTDNHSQEELVLACLFLCGLRPKALHAFFPPSWPAADALTLSERLTFLKGQGFDMDLSRIFPHPAAFSTGITAAAWYASLLHQPRLFLRIRRQKEKIIRLLEENSISCEWISDSCLALPNGSAVDGLLSPDAYVVQDASSQETGRYLQPAKGEHWWDCCSGAGGKSLLLKDLQPAVQLLVSDVRESILHNLAQRFRQYGISLPVMMTLDAGNSAALAAALGDQRFDAILSDVPCSGSGTWARTPEQLYFFRPAALQEYSSRQAAILGNAAGRVREGGRIIYITCSVFREENEDVVEKIAGRHGLQVAQMQLINGTGIGADCLFVAVLKKGA